MFPEIPLDDPSEDWRNKPINYAFSELFPIFWGPGQLTSYPDSYINPIGFKDKALMAVPAVFRGFTGGKAASPPPPPPPPPSSFSLCIPGSGNGYPLLAYRFARTAFYHTGLSDHRCCPNPSDVPYRYLYNLNIVEEDEFTYFGSTTDTETLLGTMIRLEPHSKATWMGLLDKDYLGESGRNITTLPCISGPPTCTYNQARLLANTGTDVGPGIITYNSPSEQPWFTDPWTQVEIKFFQGPSMIGGDGKFTIYFFMDCITLGICVAVQSGWNPEPNRSLLSGCGRNTPAY